MANTKTVVEKPEVVITPFDNALLALLETGSKARETMYTKVDKLARTKYGDTMPTLEQWTRDRDALKQLCADKGYSDRSLHHLNVYAQVIIKAYGAAPVAMGTEAKRKRRERIAAIGADALNVFNTTLARALEAKRPEYVAEAMAEADAKKLKSKKVQASPGAPANVPQEHAAGAKEAIEQVIARYGHFELLEGIARILAAEKETELAGITLNAISDQLRREGKRGEVASAPVQKAA